MGNKSFRELDAETAAFHTSKTLVPADSSPVLTQDLPIVGVEIDVINERDLLYDPRPESEARIEGTIQHDRLK